MTKQVLLCSGYLKRTPNHIILKHLREMDWQLKCAEQGFGKKEVN